MISRVRGTEDVLDLTLRNFIYKMAQNHLQQYNFTEIQTPILEHTNLFIHSLGAETDVVSKEMYVFNEDDEKSICLRPEATASTIRACFENRIERFPWKTFLFGPMFRKERPQKGRFRQFTQLNVEVIGSKSIAQDAFFIKMLDRFFNESFRLENYVIKLNFLGCLQDRQKHKQELVDYLNSVKSKICKTCFERKDKNALRIFDCKNEECKKLYKTAPKLIDYLCDQCHGEWSELKELLNTLSVSYVVDSHLVRGLDYYNKTVFEFTSRDLGAQDAFCGGGRYSLGRQVGAKDDFDCIGVAVGIERLVLLLQNVKDKLFVPQTPPLHIVLPVSEKQDSLGLLLANQLQLNGLACDILLEKASMTNMMKKANKMGAKYVFILGEEEQDTLTVMVKNMHTGGSKRIRQSEIVDQLRNVF